MTADDLALMPDDGHRYELIDGVLVVTPSPVLLHQRAVVRLCGSSSPPAPTRGRRWSRPSTPASTTLARRSDLTEANLPGAPVLAVEILSPSTHRPDLTLKKSRLEAAGCEHYWVLDAKAERFIAWHLVDGVYVHSRQ